LTYSSGEEEDNNKNRIQMYFLSELRFISSPHKDEKFPTRVGITNDDAPKYPALGHPQILLYQY
jgi:hypothetical protein